MRSFVAAAATYRQYTKQGKIVSDFDSRCRSSLYTRTPLVPAIDMVKIDFPSGISRAYAAIC
jgi:hypothetical protein